MPETAPTPKLSTDPTAPVITCSRLTVHYGRQAALSDVSMTVFPGATGLLGPNGAGKSSLLKSLLGFVRPATGTMTVLGMDVATSPIPIRARLGYMPESDGHIPGMNAVSFVAYCGQLSGLPADAAMQRAHEVLQYVGLGEARYRNVEQYSTGMKQRIKLAQAIVHDPDLLFLDEPTNGMDPRGRDEMLALISDLAHNKGVNLILSSHLLPDVEATCTRLVVMDKGRVAAEGTVETLKGTRGQVFEMRVKGPLDRLLTALAREGYEAVDTEEDVLRVFAPVGQASPQALFALAEREGLQVRHLRPSLPTLEDAFARVIGER